MAIMINGVPSGDVTVELQPVIYSTEEREIGVWTDGKPLYEKTLEINGTFNLSNNAWTDIISISNIDIISELSYYFSGISEIGMTDGRLRWSYSYSTEYLRAAASTGTTITNPIITLRYTKTTDTAGSGTWTPQGVPAHHYSTDEQVVGTWIDGKTIYEKTYEFENVVSVLANAYSVLVSAVDINIDTLIYGESAPSKTATFTPVSLQYINGNIEGYYPTAWSIKYLTMRYTKSST